MPDIKPKTINLSLISHTNTGKTTLARTLLGCDVGEVRDQAHTTTEATSYKLIDTPAGDSLLLWDTPGFGDSARLLSRLKQQGNPIGWFLSEVWDRYRDRALWLSQVAVRNVRDQADVILYLVNASEQPEDAGYLAPELGVLEWANKPIIVLLNQTGQPRATGEEQEEEARWRAALAEWADVRDVLPMDAFARCWVQEFSLFSSIAKVLPDEQQTSYARLDAAWKQRRMNQLAKAMEALAYPIGQAALDRMPLPSKTFLDKVGRLFGMAKAEDKAVLEQAVRSMGDRLEQNLRESTDHLIEIYELRGNAVDRFRASLSDVSATKAPLDAGTAAGLFGVLSGALSGLGADIMAGGLTFGSGMLVGAVLGGIGAAGVAKGINIVRGTTEPTLCWDEAFLDGLVISALMRYLAVAHFGRGRGEWQESENPPLWFDLVTRAVSARKTKLATIWMRRESDRSSKRINDELVAVLDEITRGLLKKLHPLSNVTTLGNQVNG
jgi:GTPase Era involved in 16S rRNA processing